MPLVLGPRSYKKREPKGSLSKSAARRSSSCLPSRCAHDLPSVKAAGANLHLSDLSVDNDASDLQIGFPGATRSIVRVRDVVAVRNAFVANVAAVSLDLRHRLTLRPDQLDPRHLRAVALAVTSLEDPSVTAISRRESGADLLEQLVRGCTVRDVT